MQKIKVCEVFGPSGYWEYVADNNGALQHNYIDRPGVTQGEGIFVGQRSTFIRTFGCNLTCPSFGLPHDVRTKEPDQIGAQVNLYKSIAQLPAAEYGCDSYFSWHPDFKQLAPMMTVAQLAAQVLQASDGSMFKHSVNPTHLIFTGGEPLLGWQRAYVELIDQLRVQDSVWAADLELSLPVTFETNGTQPLLVDKPTNQQFLRIMAQYCDITWSISAKLSASGHTATEAINPDVVSSYLTIPHANAYFKFVVQSLEDLDEVDSVLRTYSSVGVSIPVYIMPEGGTPTEYRKHSTLELVSEAVRRGYNITPRLQVLIGDNSQSW